MGTSGSAQGGAGEGFVVTEAERRVADLLPIEVDSARARATVEAVPFWFHTFALNRAEGIYTPGAARDHRYRVGRTVTGGTVLVETYGVGPEDRNGPAIRISEAGEVYARDDFVYWGFADAGLERLARIAGFARVESLINVEVDGHPRIIGQLIA
jgi:hypothetical protein